MRMRSGVGGVVLAGVATAGGAAPGPPRTATGADEAADGALPLGPQATTASARSPTHAARQRRLSGRLVLSESGCSALAWCAPRNDQGSGFKVWLNSRRISRGYQRARGWSTVGP